MIYWNECLGMMSRWGLWSWAPASISRTGPGPLAAGDSASWVRLFLALPGRWESRYFSLKISSSISLLCTFPTRSTDIRLSSPISGSSGKRLETCEAKGQNDDVHPVSSLSQHDGHDQVLNSHAPLCTYPPSGPAGDEKQSPMIQSLDDGKEWPSAPRWPSPCFCIF